MMERFYMKGLPNLRIFIVISLDSSLTIIIITARIEFDSKHCEKIILIFKDFNKISKLLGVLLQRQLKIKKPT